jgi:hypothetical protein
MTSLIDIPQEIFFEVLSLLPLKDVLNTKTTCKEFYNRIPSSAYSLYKLESTIGTPSQSQIRGAADESVYHGFTEMWKHDFEYPNHRSVPFLNSIPGIPRTNWTKVDGVTDGYVAYQVVWPKS